MKRLHMSNVRCTSHVYSYKEGAGMGGDEDPVLLYGNTNSFMLDILILIHSDVFSSNL